jgi:hypothetical protein
MVLMTLMKGPQTAATAAVRSKAWWAGPAGSDRGAEAGPGEVAGVSYCAGEQVAGACGAGVSRSPALACMLAQVVASAPSRTCSTHHGTCLAGK